MRRLSVRATCRTEPDTRMAQGRRGSKRLCAAQRRAPPVCHSLTLYRPDALVCSLAERSSVSVEPTIKLSGVGGPERAASVCGSKASRKWPARPTLVHRVAIGLVRDPGRHDDFDRQPQWLLVLLQLLVGDLICPLRPLRPPRIWLSFTRAVRTARACGAPNRPRQPVLAQSRNPNRKQQPGASADHRPRAASSTTCE